MDARPTMRGGDDEQIGLWYLCGLQRSVRRPGVGGDSAEAAGLWLQGVGVLEAALLWQNSESHF